MLKIVIAPAHISAFHSTASVFFSKQDGVKPTFAGFAGDLPTFEQHGLFSRRRWARSLSVDSVAVRLGGWAASEDGGEDAL